MSKTMLAAVAAAAAEPVSDVVDTVAENETAEATSAIPVETETPSDAVQAAVFGERKRIMSIMGAAFPGQDALARALIDGGASLGEAAIAFNGDQRAKSLKIIEAFRADETRLAGLAPEHGPANGASASQPKLTGDAAWKQDFASSEKLQAEFGGSETNYLAFKRAEKNGRFTVIRK